MPTRHRKPLPQRSTTGVRPPRRTLPMSSAGRFSIVGQVDLLQPAAAGLRATPDDRLLLRIEETDHRLHLGRPAGLFPFFDETGAYADRRRIEDQGQLHVGRVSAVNRRAVVGSLWRTEDGMLDL